MVITRVDFFVEYCMPCPTFTICFGANAIAQPINGGMLKLTINIWMREKIQLIG
jgi:hypothetical protein